MAEQGILEAFSGRPETHCAGLNRRRQEAFALFESLGWPTRRDEAWHWTDSSPLAKGSFCSPWEPSPDGPAQENLNPLFLAGEGPFQVVFVNGRRRPELDRTGKLPDGVEIHSLARLAEEDPSAMEGFLETMAEPADRSLLALADAFLQDGLWLKLAPGAVLDEPLHLLHVSTGGNGAPASFPRMVITAGKGSRASVVETYAGRGGGASLTCAVTEAHLAEGAELVHCRVQEEGPKAMHWGLVRARQEAGSRFHSHAVSLGGIWSRTEIETILCGEGAHAELDGLYVGGGDRHLDHHTFVDHAVPNCTSNEAYRGILDGSARGIFQGKVLVREDAQKTEAHQSNRNLLLSRKARADSKPQLEILADDVICSHGATIGELDEDALFYLQARGVSREEARRILVFAFAGAVADRIPVFDLRCRVDRMLAGWLAQGERPAVEGRTEVPA